MDLPVTSDDGGRVDLVLDEIVGSSKKLSSEKNDGSGTVSDLLVLLLSEGDEDTSLRVPRECISFISRRWR